MRPASENISLRHETYRVLGDANPPFWGSSGKDFPASVIRRRAGGTQAWQPFIKRPGFAVETGIRAELLPQHCTTQPLTSPSIVPSNVIQEP